MCNWVFVFAKLRDLAQKCQVLRCFGTSSLESALFYQVSVASIQKCGVFCKVLGTSTIKHDVFLDRECQTSDVFKVF